MHIHQMSVTYLPEQDHILMRINTTEGDEMRLWPTRRLMVGLWPLLSKMLTDHLLKLETAGATLLITADHGNCEMMIDPGTGGPHTAHTTNPVPLVIVGDGDLRGELRPGGSLRDVGPTILNLLGVERPADMTGKDLREK